MCIWTRHEGKCHILYYCMALGWHFSQVQTIYQFNNPFITSTTSKETVKLTQALHWGKMFLYAGPQWSHHHMTTLGQLVVSGLHCLVIMEFQSCECVCVTERGRKKDREKERERERQIKGVLMSPLLPLCLRVFLCHTICVCVWLLGPWVYIRVRQCHVWPYSIRSLIMPCDWLAGVSTRWDQKGPWLIKDKSEIYT